MTYFLILHYNEISLTNKAVESVRKIDGEKFIVIVDNASPNGTGEELVNRYENSDDVCVIVNKENEGFARGNNIGYRYIKDRGNADFVVALNNDITFPQSDFLKLLDEEYAGEEFYLAGPDVYTPNIRSHISPLDEHYKDEAAVNKRFEFIEQSIATYEKKFDLVTFTRYLQDKYQGSALLTLYNKIRGGQYSAALPFDQKAYGCVLNGACLIFDKRYVDENDFLFDEQTFLYAEEDFLCFRLTMENKKIVYLPTLKVDHVGQGSAGFGKMSYRRYCEKNIVTQKRVRESMEKYLKYMRQASVKS